MSRPSVVVTCEHAGHEVPADFEDLFSTPVARRALASHRGYDPGALQAARFLARACAAPLVVCRTTRLLIEVNRSVGHPRLYSEFSRLAGPDRRAVMRRRIYDAHRERVASAIQDARRNGAPVLHLAVHSFARRIGRDLRNAEVGLLYDPARVAERRLCLSLQHSLVITTGLRVRRNYPYRGNSDGLTTALRRRFPPGAYLGIELELCQDLMPGRSVDRVVPILKAIARGTEVFSTDRA